MNFIFNKELTKKNFDKAFNFIFNSYNLTNTTKILESLKTMGAVFSTKGGLSLSLSDLKNLNKHKKIKPFLNRISKLKDNEFNYFQSNNPKVNNIWNETNNYLKSYILTYIKKNDFYNQLLIVLESGARGSKEQIHQLIGMRSLMVDQTGSIVPYPIKSSFLDGLNVFEYLLSSFGARKGIIDTALKTADSGYLTRRLIEACYDIKIVSSNCGCVNFLGILKGRDSLKNKVKLKNTVLACNFAPNLCQYCFGINLSTRSIVSIGETIGILSAHSISEPSTQLTMRTFHTGGVFTGKSKVIKVKKISGFKIFEKSKSLKVISWDNKTQTIKSNFIIDKFVTSIGFMKNELDTKVLPFFVGFLNKQKDILKLTTNKKTFWVEEYRLKKFFGNMHNNNNNVKNLSNLTFLAFLLRFLIFIRFFTLYNEYIYI